MSLQQENAQLRNRIAELEQGLRRQSIVIESITTKAFDAVILTDREARATFVNPATEQMFEANDYAWSLLGHTRETFESGPIDLRSVTPREYAAADERALLHLMETGTAPPYQKEYIRPDGSRIPVLLGGVALQRAPAP